MVEVTVGLRPPGAVSSTGDRQVQDNTSVWGTMRQIDFSKSVLKCDCQDLSVVRFICGIVTIRAATHAGSLQMYMARESVSFETRLSHYLQPNLTLHFILSLSKYL